MIKLNPRQRDILEFIRSNSEAGNKDIRGYINKKFGDISRITIVRDMDYLLKSGLIKKIGRGRGIRYRENLENELLKFISVEEYFKQPPDKREISENFDFSILKKAGKIFDNGELELFNRLNKDYRERIKKLPTAILKKEFERLTIELSWKSSRMEGNTYSLIDTEILITENKEAKGHSREETVMILNHKRAFDYISDRRSDFRILTLRKIENIQALLVKDLQVGSGLRKKPVGIVGTGYKPLDNAHQIREAMEKTIKFLNRLSEPFSRALLAVLLISYIQPFEDGNKRTGRLLGNAILLAHEICPLSYRSIDEAEYKKAVILFYEQHSARYFKDLFAEQFRFGAEKYFRG